MRFITLAAATLFAIVGAEVTGVTVTSTVTDCANTGAIPLALIPGEATTSVAENSIETPAAEADVDTNNSGVVTPAEMPVPEITATNDVVAPGPSAPVSDSSVADVTPLASASTTASETIETEITVATASETADDASSTADEGAPVNGVGGKPSAAVGGLVAAIGALLFI